jgi:hypothetical protein
MASSQTTRDRILDALQDLPGDATFDDAIERLVFLALGGHLKSGQLWTVQNRPFLAAAETC